jgi:hypothetical protein
MSAVHALRSAARRLPRLRWIAAGAASVAVAIAITIAVWPASETDKARADGQQLGTAVSALETAQSSTEVESALADIDQAVTDSREHAGDHVADQVAAQEDALSRAADGFVGVHTSDDAFSVDVYQAELNDAVDDVTNNAADFRAEGPELQQAYWDGFQAGLDRD